MRIIAGQFRSRRLLPPASDTTRPITDRAKQSLFDMLMPYIEDAVVYDCFSGTGSMGLESLSRGCKLAVFFENDRSALGRLRQNIEGLGVASTSQIISHDIFRYFDVSPVAEARARLVFFDPPYRFLRERPDELRRAMTAISAGHLESGGLLIFRHDGRDTLPVEALRSVNVREYGNMTIEILTTAH